ncbi:MAG: type secretion system protein ImpK [Acidobacteriota bacterium]|jgi:type VI secretion system protein ImpK|nr:type secretion system protein ImpK [Acidobacteriota bacterium]
MREYGDTFLLAPFREFYREVIRLKRMVGTGAWVSNAAASHAETESEDVRIAAGTWVYFPDVIPEHDAEFDTTASRAGTRGGASTRSGSPRAASPPPWSATEPHGNGEPVATDFGQQLAPSDHARVSTFVWQRLLSLFERQEAHAWRYGGTYGAEFYKEAQYVMVALADEIFLNTEWEGRRYWVSNLLETKLFQTHAAGELIFQKLDRLLEDRDPVYRDLGAVYLMALSLGFRGKYRGGRDDGGRLLGYRRQLFAFVFRREPDLEDESRRLFPETYYHTMRDEQKRKLPNPRAWLILLCAVVLAYVAVTHGIWVKLTGRLAETNDRISRAVDEIGNNR